MKTVLILSCAINVALFATLCVLAFNGPSGHVSSGVGMTRASRAAPTVNFARMGDRRVATYANKQVAARNTPAPPAPGKIRVRVGAPLAAAGAVGVCNLATNLPALAAAGKIFDFDLTLPYMASEILLLSFFLDKLWFGPLSKVLDQRNSMMKDTMQFASGSLDECDNMVEFAEKSLRELEVSMKSERDDKLKALNAECDAALKATQEKVNKEIDEAFNGIEKDRQIVLDSLSTEIETFCWEVLDKVLPSGQTASWKKADNKLFA
ncbi:hypothetical protein AAMO2058_001567400 [Amorphochlora amoebiformis]|mmetsp:Transcript_18151/g.28913  ORF Transcript_18151/g.28913 Transcript_18151/m.28913 type:complete len:265 (-) Transcript_18151:481-1275(-)|eukprot:1341879-Amorphochlora_amoeboformis.AAC.1